MLGVPIQNAVDKYFGGHSEDSSFGWIYLVRNLLGETALILACLYSISSRYVDNWYIIEDLSLPQDLGNLSHMLRSF